MSIMEQPTRFEHLHMCDNIEGGTSGFDNSRLERISNGRLITENIDMSENLIFDSINDYELGKYGNERIEIITDIETIKGVADYLETVKELRYKEWTKLTVQERLIVLNSMENGIAKIEHRPAQRIKIEDMDSKCMGYHCYTEDIIAINTKYLVSANPLSHRRVIETILHEGRHAYQHYNVDVKSIHESLSEVKEWEKNFYDPQWRYYSYKGQKIYIPFDNGETIDVGYRLYANQPVEIDARNFASEVLRKLEGKGIAISDN